MCSLYLSHSECSLYSACVRYALQVCQAVHALFLSTRTVCVIVYDVTDSGCVDRVLALYSILQQKVNTKLYSIFVVKT